MTWYIPKESIPALLEKLSGYDVFAPVDVGGAVRYARLDGEPLLSFTNSDKPPKEVVFPQTERMFDLVVEKGRFVGATEAQAPDRPVLLLGARPCDARAMVSLDRLFAWDYVDPYYKARRDRTTVISFACVPPQMPLKNCFCTSVGGHPGSKEGADMLWTKVHGGYVVESLTDKGKAVVELGGRLFAQAKEKDVHAAKKLVDDADLSITRKLDTSGVPEALEKVFDDPYWNGFSQRCLGCGVCTLLCPTCYCFDINDVVTHGKGRRERTWDSCQYPYYTIHASGHNPRPDKRQRQRNRINHKYLYMEKRLGAPGCVGCGRCITKCPVNIDIIEVIEGAKEVASR